MSNRILVFYGSYRSDRMGIRLAEFLVDRLRRRGDAVELIDAKAVNLPMLDRMYKEYPPGGAPEQLQELASKIRDADGFVFVTGEYNWGVQPGLNRELFGRTFVRRAGRSCLARRALRDGNGGGFKHGCCWSHCTDPRG